MPVLLYAYNLLMLAALCCLAPVWLPLAMHLEKRRRTFSSRWFMQSIPMNAAARRRGRRSKPIWIHALSVGEVLSAEPLVEAMSRTFGRDQLIFTASTYTGMQTAVRVIAPHVHALRYFPYDTVFSVNRALAVIQPRQAVIVETDIWPNVLFALKQRRIPVHLVNARLSDRTFRGYRRIGFVMTPLLSVFSRICVQTHADRQRFRKLGVDAARLVTAGNIKFDQAPPEVPPGEIERLSRQLCLPAGVSVWVAGSTHEGEEDLLADAYRKIRAGGVAPQLIVAPRDPGRARDACRCFLDQGLAAATLGQLEECPRAAAVVVIDRIGMLRNMYALADVAFVGGSLVKAGGHNPLEPAALAIPVVFGPHTDDFRWICRTLEDGGGAFRVFGSAQLAQIVGELMRDNKRRRQAGRNARAVFHRHRGAVTRTMEIIAKAGAPGESRR